MIRLEECIFFRVDLCSVWLHLVEIKFRKVTWFSCTEVRLSFDWYNFVFFLFSCEWRRSRNKDDVVRIGGSNHSITKRWSIMIIYNIEGKNVLRDIVYIYIYNGSCWQAFIWSIEHWSSISRIETLVPMEIEDTINNHQFVVVNRLYFYIILVRGQFIIFDVIILSRLLHHF